MTSSTSRRLATTPKSLHTFARLALRDAPRSRRLFVLVDQIEEVFTLCEDEAARRAFFDNLLYAATVADGQTIVVLTMRADFYGKCGLVPCAGRGDVGPPAPGRADDRGRAQPRHRAARPAWPAASSSRGWSACCSRTSQGQPGSLPLLQFALMELWQRREGRRLTVAAYKAIGGLQGALKNRADDVLGQFDDDRARDSAGGSSSG